MASHSHAIPNANDDQLKLGSGARVLFYAALLVGIAGLVVTAFYPPMTTGDVRRSWFAYLTAYAFFLSLSIGGIFFVVLQYVTRAGWAVSVRRVPEAMAKVMPVMLVLGLPILYSIYQGKGELYRWAKAEDVHVASEGHSSKGETGSPRANRMEAAPMGEATLIGGPAHEGAAVASKTDLGVGDASVVGVSERPKVYVIPEVGPQQDGIPEEEFIKGKTKSRVLLDPNWVIGRDFVALLALTLIAWWYTSRSKKQDETKDPEITRQLNVRAAPMLVVFGICVTAIAFDLLMSLDPVWISTIFGGYYFAGSAIAVFAATILVCQLLQSMGYLKHSVRRDHYHDLSKFQFAFTFFWGYLAFSQFMLLWYSSQPEEVTWLARRGVSTAAIHLEQSYDWMILSFVLLFGKLLIPFAGLLSRHVKRVAAGRIFWAAWILVFHFVDMYWVVMPEYTGKMVFGIPEIAAILGVGGIYVAFFTNGLAGAALRPLNDPRAAESLAFHQSF
jgi:hypothetical protein